MCPPLPPTHPRLSKLAVCLIQVVDGLSEEPVSSAEDALELIAQGDAYRKVRCSGCLGGRLVLECSLKRVTVKHIMKGGCKVRGVV